MGAALAADSSRCSRTALTLGERPFQIDGDCSRYVLSADNDLVTIWFWGRTSLAEIGNATWDGDELIECDNTLDSRLLGAALEVIEAELGRVTP